MKKSNKNTKNQVINNQNENNMKPKVIETVVENVIVPEVVKEVVEVPEIVVDPIEVDETPEPEPQPEVIETLSEKIVRIKAEQAKMLSDLMEQKKALDEQVKTMKAEELAMKAAQKDEMAKERFDKLAALLEFPTLSKRDQVAQAIILGAATAEEVVIATGFEAKFVSDTIWGLEKSVGLR